jgi:hypothetical protein
MPGSTLPCCVGILNSISVNNFSIVDQLMVNINIKSFPPFMESSMSTKTFHCTLASAIEIHHLAMTRLLRDTVISSYTGVVLHN